MKRLVASLCGAIAFVSCAASAADSTQPTVIKTLEAQGAGDLHEFKVNENLRAFAGVSGGNPIAVYVLPSGNAIVGARIDRNGAPLDIATVDDLVAGPMGNATWKQLQSAKWILVGRKNAPRTVYVITDPNCPYCHRFWTVSRPWVESGKVQLRELLVGVIRADSAAKAAAILDAPNPSAAFNQNERDFDKGGISPASTISSSAKQILEANLQLMQTLGLEGTPGLIYKSADGTVKRLDGLPQGDQLRAVLGP